MNYHQMKYGPYEGDTLDEIPMEYLIWLYGVLSHKKKHQSLKTSVLQYFLDQDILVDHSNPSIGHRFFFNRFHYPNIDGTERPFMTIRWRGTNSKGEYVYEAGNKKFPIYFEEKDGKFIISNKYVSLNYKADGVSLVYERNPKYYFYDNQGRMIKGGYLIRKPYTHESSLDGFCGENLLIENLNKLN